MKAIKSKHIMLLLVAASLILTGSAFAQPESVHSEGMGKECMSGMGPGKHMQMIPDLTEEQKEQMETLHKEHMEAISSLQDELVVKMALLQSLSIAEKVNMNEINQTIDEIGEIKTKMMKERAAHRQEIRKLLTEKQRLVFDMHPMPQKSHPHER